MNHFRAQVWGVKKRSFGFWAYGSETCVTHNIGYVGNLQEAQLSQRVNVLMLKDSIRVLASKAETAYCRELDN